MGLIIVGANGTSTISQTETDSVSFLAAGTLNVVGTPQAPITVTLSQVAGTAAAATIGITNATVHLNGVAGVSALVTFVIGNGGMLDIQNSVGITVGSTLQFTGTTGRVVIGGATIAPFTSITGFGPGKSIDLTTAAVSRVSYTDAAGTNTGGVLSLYDANNTILAAYTLTNGDFVNQSFRLQDDGVGGTLIDFSTVVTGIAATPATATLGPNASITLTVSTSNPVSVSGTPTLALNDGGTAVYDAALSTSTQLAFTYTVAAGQNTADLAVTGIALNGAALVTVGGGGVDLSGAIGNPSGTLVIDTVAPTVTSVTTAPGSGTLAAGQTVAITVALSEAVSLTGGAPTLALNDGGTATYDAASSTSTSLAFRHTVQPGQNAADLAVTGVSLNGAAFADPAGNPLALAGAIGNPAGTLIVDTRAPTVTSVTTTPGSGVLAAGQTVAITVALSETVSLTGGAPTVALNDGGTATYDVAGSTPTSMVFRHTVQPGQNAADLAITGVSLNGATAADPAGNPLDLSGAVSNPAGILVIDTLAPIVGSVATSPGSGVLAAGQTVAITVALSEAVSLTGGTPTLALNDGGTATYDAASSTPTSLVFRHTVQPGQNAADLSVTAVSLNGATVADPAGNLLDLSGAVGNPSGILVIDTTSPSVTSVTTAPGSGVLAAGQTVAITVALNEAVSLSGGAPTLALNDGGTATYDAASSTPTSLVFRHTIQPGQNTADLAITGVTPNGAGIVDPAGNLFDLAGVIGNPPGILTVDTTPPTTTAISTSPSSGVLSAGQTVAIVLSLSEPISSVGGTPTLALNDGGTATYDAASSTPTSLVFRHTVQAGQNAADLTVTAVSLNGAVIADPAGNPLDLAAALGNPPGTLVIDTVAPVVASVSTSPSSGNIAAGQTVAFSVTLSEPVAVTVGTPTLALNDGGTAIYDPASSTPTTLVFRHTVQPGQNAADLAVTGVSGNGATIADLAGNPLDLAGLLGNPPGTLTINTTAPTITSVSTLPGSGTLVAGQTVMIGIALSEAVFIVGGTPTLTLDDGGTATYDAASSTPTSLVFRHTVQTGQNSPDLAITAVNLSGAVIADAAGNVLDLAAAAGNPPGLLSVDTTAPLATSVSATPGSGNLIAGQSVAFTITLSEAVAIVGGSPTLSLNDGGTATYDAVGSTPTSLVFRHTIQSGQNAADLAITAANLNGATIADAAGNPLDPASLAVNPPGVLVVDTAAPIVASVATTPGSGALAAGQTVAFVLALSEAVSLAGGTPSLALNDGGSAAYDAASSTPTSLVFRHTVQPGQNAADLAVTAVVLNGAALADPAGNPLDLAAAIGNPDGLLAVDTVAPRVASVAAVPGSGRLMTGQTVVISVALTEAVSLVGGVPTLTLDDGGTATYDAASSSPNNLVFRTTVRAGETSAALAVTAAALNGATLADSAGNLLDLAGAIGPLPGLLVVDGSAAPAIVPSVLGLSTTPGSGTLVPGQSVSFTVATNEPVTVVGGIPTLALSDGGIAIYDPVHSTPTRIVFTSIVQPGQLAADLAVTGFDLHGTTIADAAGGLLSLAAAVVNPAGLLGVAAAPTPSTTPSTTAVTPTATVPATLSVYRFFDTRAGTHFYTTNPDERAAILQSRPDLVPEGADGVGLRAVNPASNDATATEVFRFFDSVHGTQFLTASASERDAIVATRPDLQFEPAGSFFEHIQPQPGDTPVYRFFSSADGTHFYTDNAAERASIIQSRPDLIAEGIGFYEPS